LIAIAAAAFGWMVKESATRDLGTA
jgi:hypothetical protein